MRNRLAAPVSLLLGLLVSTAFAACGDAASSPNPNNNRTFVPALSRDDPAAQSRSFGMGFFVTPSVPSVAATVAMVPKMAKVADYAMIQREVPWTRIAAGDSFDKIIDDEYVELVKYLRGNGLKIVLLVDPLDGLNRTAESIEATKNHRTLADTATRDTHAAWVEALVGRIKPDYIGLASEINTLAAHGNASLYQQIRAMCNTLAPRLRSVSPASRVFVSFQVDDAWGNAPFSKSSIDHFALTRDFDVDVIGLSSYPAFVYASPANIPADYYQRFVRESGKPLLMAEGGWGSSGGPNNSPEKQADYYRRMLAMLNDVHAELAILLLYNDLDLSDSAWGLTPDRQKTLGNFANMGIVDLASNPKPVYAPWQEWFHRPLVR